MTLTEKMTNPEITAMPTETLTQPEMEKATGGGIGDTIDAIWKIEKCEFDNHDLYLAGVEHDIVHWCHCARQVWRCSRCSHVEYGSWYIERQNR